MEAAEQNLREHQEQLDADGTMVGVSRQALDETLARIAEIESLLTEVQRDREIQAATALDHYNTMLALQSQLSAVQTKLDKAVKALNEISRQKLTTEMDEDKYEGADFDGAYDTIIGVARAALDEIQDTVK